METITHFVRKERWLRVLVWQSDGRTKIQRVGASRCCMDSLTLLMARAAVLRTRQLRSWREPLRGGLVNLAQKMRVTLKDAALSGKTKTRTNVVCEVGANHPRPSSTQHSHATAGWMHPTRQFVLTEPQQCFSMICSWRLLPGTTTNAPTQQPNTK